MSSAEFPLIYTWHVSTDGTSAHAETPLCRIKVSRHPMNADKWVAWVRGNVIGRNYVSLASAQRAAEHKVAKLMQHRAA